MLIATGSPFDNVNSNGVSYEIGQSLTTHSRSWSGLGSIVAEARIITPAMFAATADAIAEMVDLEAPEQDCFQAMINFRGFYPEVAIAVAGSSN